MRNFSVPLTLVLAQLGSLVVADQAVDSNAIASTHSSGDAVPEFIPMADVGAETELNDVDSGTESQPEDVSSSTTTDTPQTKLLVHMNLAQKHKQTTKKVSSKRKTQRKTATQVAAGNKKVVTKAKKSTTKPAKKIAKKKKTTTKKKKTTTVKKKGSVKTGPSKRGLAYNNADYTELFGKNTDPGSQVSWTYNWYMKACGDGTFDCGYNTDLRYVPMLWGNASDLVAAWPAAAQAAIDSGSTALFSFNEPDLCVGGSSCMSVSSAVKAWKKYIQPFAGKAKLGLPAVTNGGAPYGLTWLQKFVAACDGCTFDFVNLHWYSNIYAGANYFESHVNSARAFGLPIWITEYGLTNDYPYTQDQLGNFLEQTMSWMDQQPDIHAYSYFFASTGFPYLVNSGGNAVSPTGNLYNTFVNDTRQPNLYS